MEMKVVSNVQFGQLNNKQFYFSNGLMSLPYGHPCLEDLRKEKQKCRAIHKTIQDKKYDFLKQESNAMDNNPRMQTNCCSKPYLLYFKFHNNFYYKRLEIS